MKTLSESQTDLIIQWVKSHHLTIRSLEDEFIDHICCDVEELMNNGNSFKIAFEGLQNDLGDDVLTGLEKQTILKLTFNDRFMKFMTRFAGFIVLLSFFLSMIFKFMGIEYWNTLMAGGMAVLSLGFAPLFFLDHYNQQEVKSQKVLHIFGFLAAFLIPAGAFLGIFNSPYSLLIIAVGILFLVFGFIPLSWLTISKGTGRSLFTGSIIFLLFFIFLSYGFLGVKISKDRIDSWIYISKSTMQSISVVEKMNSEYELIMKKDSALVSLTSEITGKSDKLVQDLIALKTGFVKKLSPNTNPDNPYFKNMDNHYSGKKLLIENEKTDLILTNLASYKNWLISILSEENEQVKEKIDKLLIPDSTLEKQDLNSQKNYLFRDFPAITDVSIINGIILNVRIAENQTMKFLAENAGRKQ